MQRLYWCFFPQDLDRLERMYWRTPWCMGYKTRLGFLLITGFSVFTQASRARHTNASLHSCKFNWFDCLYWRGTSNYSSGGNLCSKRVNGCWRFAIDQKGSVCTVSMKSDGWYVVAGNLVDEHRSMFTGRKWGPSHLKNPIMLQTCTPTTGGGST